MSHPASPAILVIGPSWVGDMVMAQSLFITLKQRYPDAAIDVLAPAWSLGLLQRMPQVRQGIAMPLGHGQFDLMGRYRLGQSLKAHHYQQAIVLPNSWKSALIPFFAAIPQRMGYLGEQRWGLLTQPRRLNKALLPMTVQRFVALGLPVATTAPSYSLPALQISNAQQQAVCQRFDVQRDTPVLALCPGAEYGPAKRWPVAHFAAVASHHLQQGGQVWLMGSDKDHAIAEAINALTDGACLNFAGKTQLTDAIDLLSLADTVVSNDSGLMHVAAALGKPVVALYGSSDPRFTPPLHPNARILRLGLDCSPCFKRVCPLQHTRCLSEISPQQVITALAG